MPDEAQEPAASSDGTPVEEGRNEPAAVALQVIRNCVAGRVRQISRVVTARYDQELSDLGITANQVTILSVIAVLGQATPSDLAPYLQMDASTISRNVQRMLDRHWLAIIPGEDRRSHFLVSAPQGLELLRQVKPAWERAQAWAEQMFDADGVAAIRRIATVVNPLIPA